jgi:hypothetical protein
MSQVPRLARARQLTAAVWPGRAVEGYGNLIAARLGKLAAAHSTGILPFTGQAGGAIYFADGRIAYAESGRTPRACTGPLARTAPRGPAGPGAGVVIDPDTSTDPAIAVGPRARGPRPLHVLTGMLAVTEPTVDAALELLASESRY